MVLKKIVVIFALFVAFVVGACESDSPSGYVDTGVPRVKGCARESCLTGKSFPADDKGLIQMITK